MTKCILFIDGENFLHKIREIFVKNGFKNQKLLPVTIDLNKLFKSALKDFNFDRKVFYVARLHQNNETLQKSIELIKFQRKLRNALVKQGYEFIISGNVRSQKIGNRVVFREKGVDVRMAVDLTTNACDKNMNTAVICSSDSDLQPAIREIKKRKVQTVYLGFEASPNKGLSYTTDRTILLRNHEIISALKTK